jgi:hypothetical protein
MVMRMRPINLDWADEAAADLLAIPAAKGFTSLAHREVAGELRKLLERQAHKLVARTALEEAQTRLFAIPMP